MRCQTKLFINSALLLQDTRTRYWDHSPQSYHFASLNKRQMQVNSCTDFHQRLDMKILVHVPCLTRIQLTLLSTAVCAKAVPYIKRAKMWERKSPLVVEEQCLLSLTPANLLL